MQQVLDRLEQLDETLKHHGTKSILLVTSEHSAERSGLEKLLTQYSVIHLKARSNPNIHTIERAITLCRQHAVDTVLAVGGGSAIDTAKAARMLVGVEGSAVEIVKENLSLKSPLTLFIAVPTTAGSGAEATHFAVVYIDEKKYSLSHQRALPDVVVLDPRLTYCLPPHITATSGIDAVAQAIEAYWSVRSTEKSRNYSKAALEKLLPNLDRSVHNPTPTSRRAMLEGAHLAGQAINIAQTTGPHALSYGFTSLYGVDHGEAVSLTLPQFLRFNSALNDNNCQDERGSEFVKDRIGEITKLLGATTVDEAARKVADLAASIGLMHTVQTDDLSTLVETVNLDRLKNNPRLMTPNDIRSILMSATVS